MHLGAEEAPVREINRGDGLNDIWLPFYLAASKEYLAAGAPVFAFGWKRRGERNLIAQVPFSIVADLDIFGDRLLILGAQRNEKGEFAPDGAIAWLGPLSEDLSKLKTVLYSEAGARVKPINDCGSFEISNVRFLPDGSLVIVPGVEFGVLLYDANGKLQRTWQSESLGFDAGCKLTEEEAFLLKNDEPARWNWVNQRRTVDDILPLAEGPGLLIRTRGPDETTWRLKILDRKDGGVRTCDIPISSPSGLTQLHGDVAGDRVVFLLWVHGPGRRRGGPSIDLDAPPEVPPRLFTMQLSR
ncbi:MAG: hypothetical protein AAF657_00695 [Acidobacteriota bacterium]